MGSVAAQRSTRVCHGTARTRRTGPDAPCGTPRCGARPRRTADPRCGRPHRAPPPPPRPASGRPRPGSPRSPGYGRSLRWPPGRGRSRPTPRGPADGRRAGGARPRSSPPLAGPPVQAGDPGPDARPLGPPTRRGFARRPEGWGSARGKGSGRVRSPPGPRPRSVCSGLVPQRASAARPPGPPRRRHPTPPSPRPGESGTGCRSAWTPAAPIRTRPPATSPGATPGPSTGRRARRRIGWAGPTATRPAPGARRPPCTQRRRGSAPPRPTLRTARSSTGPPRNTRPRKPARARRSATDEPLGRATGTGWARGTRALPGSRAEAPGTAGARRGRRSQGRWMAGRPRGSGAVAAEHLGLVLELASVLHQVALLAYELGGLRRDHLDRERLEALLSRQAEEAVILLFLALPGLLLDQEVLDRLDVFSVGCGRRSGDLFGRCFGVLGFLLDLFVLEALFDVFHVPSFRPGDSTAGKQSGNPFRRLNASGPLLVPTGGNQATRTKERKEDEEDPRDLWGHGAGAPSSLLSLLGPRRVTGKRRRGRTVGPSADRCQTCRPTGHHHAAYTSRPSETVSTGRSPSNEEITIGSTS